MKIISSPMPYGKEGKMYCPICNVAVLSAANGRYFCSKCKNFFATQKEHDKAVDKFVKGLK